MQRLAYYKPIDEIIDGRISLVDHASKKLLYNELAPIFELCSKRSGEEEARFISEIAKNRGYVSEKTNLLDLGCGVGRISRLLSGKFEVTGIDISSDVINEARSKVPSATFAEADMRSFHLDNTFEVAICMWSTFNYLGKREDILGFLNSVNRHLTSDGVLIIDMPNHSRTSLDPYSRTEESNEKEVTIEIQKRIVGGFCEGIYFYRILDRKSQKTQLFCDQEVHRVFSIEDVKADLGGVFELIEVHGEYDIASDYKEDISSRRILILKKTSQEN